LLKKEQMNQKFLNALLIAVTIVLSAIILLFLHQNLKLKQDIANLTQGDKKNSKHQFERFLEESFLFKKFPVELDIDNFYFYNQHKPDYINGYIVLISDLTVCGKCLDEELEVMSTLREKTGEKNLLFLGIIGVNDPKEEAEIINLHKTGAIFFPCKTIDADSLYRIFKLNRDYFLDTPFYFYISHEFITLDIFKPPLMDKKEMIRWLTIVTAQDVF